MAKPQFLQTLIHGKFITQKVFPTFVETWNYLLNRVENIRGDKDENESQGFIRVDNTDEENVVIRFEPPSDFWKRNESGGGEGFKGCFEYTKDGDSPTLINTYYRIGGKTYTLTDSPSFPTNGILALKIDATGETQGASYVNYSNVAAMQGDESDYDYFIAPLYTFSNGEIVCDWRKSAPIVMTEF